ncbi:putative Ccc1 family protein [Helianthus annuus]|uniref:Vacuolar iron transporter n=1 Tax=Helianthus annuus TaxID=4232 RepID=A0A251V7D8_HELAN|nr:vacuolar iron transporter homolog 4 [Helianthus annuus]KAF5813742.1 putative Ccc1 family protein [Helianthus annuus]
MTTTNTIEDSEHPIIKHNNQDVESQRTQEATEVTFDYAKRAQWLRAALLGANDGLLSTASIMMGVGAVSEDVKTMILSGIATLLGGACSMAIGEFVSVYSQYDIEMSQIKREMKNGLSNANQIEEKKSDLPSPTKAAVASATAFALGAVVPLLAAAFIRNYRVRLAVVVAVVSLTLIGFGSLSAVLGRAPLVKSTLRILIGGWVAMAVTFGSTKAVGSTGLIST